MAALKNPKSPPESDVKARAWARLFVVSSLLVGKVEEALKTAGLPPLAWYDLLWILESNDGRLRMHELAARAVVARYNLTRLADRLEEEGLIEREKSESDRRGAYCVLTDRGRALRRRMWPVYKATIDESFGGVISLEEARGLAAALDKVRKHLRGDEEDL